MLPQAKDQIAGAPLTRAFKLKLAELDLHDLVFKIRRWTVFGKQRDRLGARSAMFEHLDRFTPRLMLIVIDLTEIKYLALYNAIALAAAILNEAPIAVLLTIFETSRSSQKHAMSVTKTTNTSIGQVFTTRTFRDRRLAKSVA